MAEQTVTVSDLETPPPRLFTRMAAEAFGTFVLVLGIVGTATFNAANGGSIITVALAGGIALMASIAAVGHLSGGHFNPAVTFGLTLAGRSSWADLLPYWVAQFVGAAACGGLLLLIIPEGYGELVGSASSGEVLAATANGYGDHSPMFTVSQGAATFDLATAAIVEVLIAAVFVGVILGVTNPRAKITYPAVVIGLTLGALHIISWLVTNTGFNPARSFASVISPDAWGEGNVGGQLWLFLVAPLVGGALAALFVRAFAPVPTVADPVEGWEAQPGTAPAAAEAATVAAVASATAAAVVAKESEDTTGPRDAVPDEQVEPVEAQPADEPTHVAPDTTDRAADDTTDVEDTDTSDGDEPPTRP